MANRPTQDHFPKVSIYNFSDHKKYKKGYIELKEKNYLETFKKCPSISVYFPLLPCYFLLSIFFSYTTWGQMVENGGKWLKIARDF